MSSIPSKVLGALNLIRLLNYHNERCLYCWTSRKQTEVPHSSSPVIPASVHLFNLLLHLEVLVLCTDNVCCISYQLRGVLDVHGLGTRPCFCLVLEFGEFSPSSAVADVRGYYACLGTVSEALPEQIILCLFITWVIFSLPFFSLAAFFFFPRDESNI